MRQASDILDREEIKRFIPHRDPFLWLDKVIEISDERIVAQKHIDPELDLFSGHYPGNPVLPGVIQCEAAFQAGAVLLARIAEMGESQVPVVTRQQNTQFRRMVRPGDTLEIEVTLTEKLGSAYFLKGKVSVDGKTTARLEFACTAVDADQNR